MSVIKGTQLVAGHTFEKGLDAVIHDASLTGAGTVSDPLAVVMPDIYHPSLFDCKYADYRLDEVSWLRSETFSWQSGGIYEAGINHLKNDIEDEDTVQKSLIYKNNVSCFGNCAASSKGNLSGFFQQYSYAKFNVKVPTSSLTLEMDFTTPTSYANASSLLQAETGYKGIIARFTTAGVLQMWLSSNGTSWNIMSTWATGITIAANTRAKFKLTWNGTTYATFYSLNNGATWTAGNTLASTLAPAWTTGLQGIGGCTWENYAFTNGIVHLPGCLLDIDGERYWDGVNTITYYQAKDGHAIVLPSEADKVSEYFQLYKRANFFIYDGENERLKLPRKNERYIVKSYKTNSQWYNLYSDGWVEQGGTLGTADANYRTKPVAFPVEFVDTAYTFFLANSNTDDVRFPANYTKTTKYITVYNTYNKDAWGNWRAEGYASDAAIDFTPKKEYYYMGYFTPTALANTGSLLEGLNNKMDNDMNNVPSNIDYVIESWTDGTSWYRVYKSGWCEQGGEQYVSNTTVAIAFLKPYVNSDYYANCRSVSSDTYGTTASIENRSTTTMGLRSTSSATWCWEAKGYIR